MEAVVLKDEVLRLHDIPLIIRLPGMPQAARGSQVRLEILRWDELDLSVEARVLEMLSSTAEDDLGDEAEDELETETEVVVEAIEPVDASVEIAETSAEEEADSAVN